MFATDGTGQRIECAYMVVRACVAFAPPTLWLSLDWLYRPMSGQCGRWVYWYEDLCAGTGELAAACCINQCSLLMDLVYVSMIRY